METNHVLGPIISLYNFVIWYVTYNTNTNM